jgi:hypothetical protein
LIHDFTCLLAHDWRTTFGVRLKRARQRIAWPKSGVLVVIPAPYPCVAVHGFAAFSVGAVHESACRRDAWSVLRQRCW